MVPDTLGVAVKKFVAVVSGSVFVESVCAGFFYFIYVFADFDFFFFVFRFGLFYVFVFFEGHIGALVCIFEVAVVKNDSFARMICLSNDDPGWVFRFFWFGISIVQDVYFWGKNVFNFSDFIGVFPEE